jgi:hypothetical protein
VFVGPGCSLRTARTVGSLFFAAGGLLVFAGCGGAPSQQARSATAETTMPPSYACAPDTACPAASAENSLPRYFALTLEGSRALFKGEHLQPHELSKRIKTEASDARNAGATVWLGGEFSGEALGALVWELSGAGFDHIVISRITDEPAEVADEQSEQQASTEEDAASEDAAVSSARVPRATEHEKELDAEAKVAVSNLGLHVGGGPNDDATKALYAEPISGHFDAFRRCYRHALNPEQPASVGVDLLIPARGGTASVKDFRTKIRGDDFEKCAKQVFRQVEFPRGERPTMISYSLLFTSQD